MRNPIPPGAHEPEDRGAPDVGFEPEQGVAHEPRHDLGEYGKGDGLAHRGPGAGQGLHLGRVDGLDLLAEDLAQDAEGVDPEGQDSGIGAQPDHGHEDEGHDELVEPAAGV